MYGLHLQTEYFLTNSFVMTEQKILEALSNVQEPDLGKDLVTLNMVKDIVINGNDVSFTIVLTTPACWQRRVPMQ